MCLIAVVVAVNDAIALLVLPNAGCVVSAGEEIGGTLEIRVPLAALLVLSVGLGACDSLPLTQSLMKSQRISGTSFNLLGHSK